MSVFPAVGGTAWPHGRGSTHRTDSVTLNVGPAGIQDNDEKAARWQWETLTLLAANDPTNIVGVAQMFTISALVGDANGDKNVASADSSAIKAHKANR